MSPSQGRCLHVCVCVGGCWPAASPPRSSWISCQHTHFALLPCSMLSVGGVLGLLCLHMYTCLVLLSTVGHHCNPCKSAIFVEYPTSEPHP